MGFSSLDRPPGGGVAVEARFGDLLPLAAVVDLRDGVPGLLVGRCVARLSSSARRSCSGCPVTEGCFDCREPVVLAGFDADCAPRSSNWARSSSLVGAFFEDMVRLRVMGAGNCVAVARAGGKGSWRRSLLLDWEGAKTD